MGGTLEKLCCFFVLPRLRKFSHSIIRRNWQHQKQRHNININHSINSGQQQERSWLNENEMLHYERCLFVCLAKGRCWGLSNGHLENQRFTVSVTDASRYQRLESTCISVFQCQRHGLDRPPPPPPLLLLLLQLLVRKVGCGCIL